MEMCALRWLLRGALCGPCRQGGCVSVIGKFQANTAGIGGEIFTLDVQP